MGVLWLERVRGGLTGGIANWVAGAGAGTPALRSMLSSLAALAIDGEAGVLVPVEHLDRERKPIW